MDEALLRLACNLFHTTPEQLEPLFGGHTNAVYRFPLTGATQPKMSGQKGIYGVLRIGVEDCPADQTLGILEWVKFLSEQGAPVTAPILSRCGQLLEKVDFGGKTYTITAFEEAEGILAERIPVEDWTDELFTSIGRAAGKMHAISKRYRPGRASITRPAWFDSYEIQNAMQRLAQLSDPASVKLTALIQQLKYLPVGPDNFGMIHDDLHFANFLIQQDGVVKIIDFDDCIYGWYSMDVSMALFDVLVLFDAPSERLCQEFARRFMLHYLAGYRQENDLAPFWLEQLRHFLKLKEICVYAPLIGHPEINLPDSWVGRFMRGRAERIACDIPYVDIDFKGL